MFKTTILVLSLVAFLIVSGIVLAQPQILNDLNDMTRELNQASVREGRTTGMMGVVAGYSASCSQRNGLVYVRLVPNPHDVGASLMFSCIRNRTGRSGGKDGNSK